MEKNKRKEGMTRKAAISHEWPRYARTVAALLKHPHGRDTATLKT